MFTGIIQDLGTIQDIILNDHSMRLGISTSLDKVHLTLGASIACNGCCLTITKVVENIFFVDIGPETLALTRFAKLNLGDKINLEPALRVGDALGGHQVSGHVDGVFNVFSFVKIDENFWKLSLIFPNKFSKFMILKGSIAIAGISLTIANIYSQPNDMVCAEFMIIPHTYFNTILQFTSANFNSFEVEFDQSTKTIASLIEGMIINYSQKTK